MGGVNALCISRGHNQGTVPIYITNYMRPSLHLLKIRGGFNNAPSNLVLRLDKTSNTILLPSDFRESCNKPMNRFRIYLHSFLVFKVT